MNKKLIIGIVVALAVVGGIIAAVSLKNKSGENTPEVELDTYSIESATTDNKIDFKIAKNMGYTPVEGTMKGSLILENTENNTKLTYYFKHASRSSIIAGEDYYKTGYYGYQEYEVNGHEASIVKKGEDSGASRVEFSMILGEDESDKRYNGVSVYLEYNDTPGEDAVNLEQLFAGEDMRKMLESIEFVAAE